MANRYPSQPSQGMKRQQTFQQQPQALSPEQVQKQRDYLKQQQKLRLMASSSHKGNLVSTDTLIENLLGKKNTFHPVDLPLPTAVSTTNVTRVPDASQGQAHFETLQPFTVEWLSPNSPMFPSQYHQVWSMVGLSDGMVDTAKVYPLLLTSGLHTDVLGFIWGLSNQRVPGTLTEQELYVLLALVALAQSGYSFNSANVLSLVPQPPVPNLNLGVESQVMLRQESNPTHLTSTQYTTGTSSTSPLTGNQNFAAQTPASFSYEQSFVDQHSDIATFPSMSSTVQSDFDDFTDFQSASCAASSMMFSLEPTEIADLPQSVESKELQSESSVEPSISPSTSQLSSFIDKLASPPHDSRQTTVQKFPTVAVVGGGRSIGSRLANHSLTTPKPTKTRHHKHHHHHHHRSVPPQPPSISVDEEFSDFQQASSEDVSKCLSKPPSTHTYLLKESAIRVNDNLPIPKIPEPGIIKPPVPLITKDHQTGITAHSSSQAPVTNAVDDKDANVLMGVEEDRYSALRALSAFSASPAELEDEYGDFFSASATAPTNNEDSFADIAARDNTAIVDQVVPPWPSTEAAAPQTSKFEVDDWNTFVSSRDSVHPSRTQIEENTTGPSHIKAYERPHSESSNDWKMEPSIMDTLSTQVADLNLRSFDYSTSLQTEKEASAPPIIGNDKEQDILSLFDQVGHPVTSLPNVVSSISISQNIEDNDDFGDFVSPVSFCEKVPVLEKDSVGNFWSDEGKESDSQSVGKLWLDDSKSVENQPLSDEGTKYDHIKLSKDGILDNPLVSSLWLEEGKGVDNQSVRSLELPGLDQAWDSVGEWRRCVQSCVSVLQFAVDTFESVSEPKVLLEVLTSLEGQDYLKGLVEVWAVCERLATSYRQSGTDHKLDALLNSAESMWVSLKPHYLQAQLPIESYESTEGGELCGICLVGGAKLEFSGHTYHAACANLWLNLVDTGLPALHQPCI